MHLKIAFIFKISILIFFSLGYKKIFAQTDSSIIIRDVFKSNGPGLTYERVINEHFSLTYNAKYVRTEPYYDFSWRGGEFFPNIISYRRVNGYAFVSELRYYPFPHKNRIPSGLYLAPFFKYKKVKQDFKVSALNYAYVQDSIDCSNIATSTEIGGGMTLGYQIIMEHGFTFDLYGGVFFRENNIDRKFIDSHATESLLIQKYGNAVLTNKASTAFRAGITIGYAFNWRDVCKTILPSEKKYLLKTGIGFPIGNMRLSYEQFLGNRFSIQLSAGYFYFFLMNKFINQEFSGSHPDSITSESSGFKKGYNVSPSLRWYLTLSHKPFPIGIYLSPIYRYRYIDYVFTDIDTIPSNIKYDYEEKVHQKSIGFAIGYQSLIKNNFLIDFYIGPIYNDNTLTRMYKSPLADDNGLNNKFSVSNRGEKFYKYWLISGLNIGYAF